MVFVKREYGWGRDSQDVLTPARQQISLFTGNSFRLYLLAELLFNTVPVGCT